MQSDLTELSTEARDNTKIMPNVFNIVMRSSGYRRGLDW
jgi:hypothetical protein